MGINHYGSGQRVLPDPELEEVHEEEFGLTPEAIGIPLSHQGLVPVARKQPESVSTVPTEPAEEQRRDGEGSV